MKNVPIIGKFMIIMDSVRQDGVISGVDPGRHDQAALGVI